MISIRGGIIILELRKGEGELFRDEIGFVCNIREYDMKGSFIFDLGI